MEGVCAVGGVCLICRTSNLELSGAGPPTPFHDQWSQSPVLSNQLNVYFLLRHVLELPSELLEKFLRRFPRPEDWVKICRGCNSDYVEKCGRTFLELLEVKRRFVEARHSLIEAMKRSSKAEEDAEGIIVGKCKIQPKSMLEVDLEIRRFVFQNGHSSSLPEQVNPFEKGDLLARRAAEKIHDEIKIERDFSTFSSPEIDINSEPTAATGSNSGDLEDPTSDLNPCDIKMEAPSPKPDARNDWRIMRRRKAQDKKSDFMCGYKGSSDDDGSDDTNSSCGEDWNPDNHLSDFSDEEQEEMRTAVNQNEKQLSQSKHQHDSQSDSKDTTCPTCDAVMPSRTFLHQHMTICKDDTRERIQCKYCDKKFLGKQSYNKHLKLAHGEGTKMKKREKYKRKLRYRCPFPNCNEAFSAKDQRKKHEVTHHVSKPKITNINPSVRCKICGKLLQHKSSMKKHMLIHQFQGGHTPFQCKICGQHLSGEYHLERHMKTVHNPNRKPKLPSSATQKIQKKYKDQRSKPQFKCDLCSETFQTASRLRKHQILKHKTNLYECSKCDFKTYSTEENQIKKHMKRYHGTEEDLKDLTCAKCGKILSEIGTLILHQSLCHNENRAKLVCEQCGKVFLTRACYFNHLGSVHGITDQLKFRCTFEGCDKAFFTKSHLNDHEVVHKPPQHECHICGATFKQKQIFNKHIKCHQSEGKKPHLCDLCPASYARSDNLLAHKRRAHSETASAEDKPQVSSRCVKHRSYYRCSECKILFNWRYHLISHRETAHGGNGIVLVCKSGEDQGEPEKETLRRFKCDAHACLFSFHHSIGLQRHRIKVHGVFKCRKCEWQGENLDHLQNHEKECQQFTAIREKTQKDGKFYCEHCDEDCTTISGLRRHITLVHGLKVTRRSKATPIKCDLCGIVYASRPSLLDHMKRMHNNEKRSEGNSKVESVKFRKKKRGKNMTCIECNLRFPRQISFQQHMESIHGVTSNQAPTPLRGTTKPSRIVNAADKKKEGGCCDQCGKLIGDVTLLKRHKAKVHQIGVDEVPRIQCSVEGCTREFWTKGQMDKHIQRIHEGQRSYQCEHCGKNLVSAPHLKRHILAMHSTNRESKPFKCDECGKGFAVRQYLWLHKKTHKKKTSGGEDFIQL